MTTSSALGRSSIYNRLRLDGETLFESVGYTSGWGHFHFSEQLFEEMRDFLASRYSSFRDTFDFGEGPNWRLRVIKKALSAIGLDPSLALHGMEREVFLCRLAPNSDSFLRGEQTRLQRNHLKSIKEISLSARDRWLVPRAERRAEFRLWERESLRALVRASSATTGAASRREIESGMGR